MDKETIIKEVANIVGNHLTKDYKIFLFGSWARGGAGETSDLDIGILGPSKVPWPALAKILKEVAEIPTLRKVDVVDLNLVDDVFRNKVLQYAVAL